MANILNLITIGEKKYLVVDNDPAAGSGTEAEIASIAVWQDSSNVGRIYLKTGPLNTDWQQLTASGNIDIEPGNFLRLALYKENPSGTVLNDQVQQNGHNVSVKLQAQPSRTTGIEYVIPNPGNSISSADFVLTEGAQTINGTKTFTSGTYFESTVQVDGDLYVNGALTYVNTTNTNIADKLITLNKGGGLPSAGGSGIEFEEGDIITGYIKQTDDRDGFDIKPSDTKNDSFVRLDFSLLNAPRTQSLADTHGVFVMRSDLEPGVYGNIAFYLDDNKITNSNNLYFDNDYIRFGIGTNTPSHTLHVNGGARIVALTDGLVRSDSYGVLQNGAVNLTTEVSGVLPIANGGTNSGTALNNNRIMVSSGGAIVEAAALTNGQLLIGSTGGAPVAANIAGTTNRVIVTNGPGSITLSTPQDIATTSDVQFNSLQLNLTPGSVVFAGPSGLLSQDNPNLFWDDNNNRLGVRTNTPSRALDIQGNSIFRDDFRIEKNNANYEIRQAQVSTTDATVTEIASVAIPTNSQVMIKAKIVGRRTGGTAGNPQDGAVYERTARFKNVSGTVTMHNLQSDYTSEDQAGFDGTMAVSGTNASIRVRGAANNNMDWTVTYEVITL